MRRMHPAPGRRARTRLAEPAAEPEAHRAARRPRVLLTRAADRLGTFAAGCGALGLDPVCLPCIAIEWLDAPHGGGVPPASLPALPPESPPTRGIVVYTSVPAVTGAARLRALPWPGTRALAIGAATAAALTAAGQAPCAPPVEPYTSEALLAWLLGPAGSAGSVVPGSSAGAPSVRDGVTIVKGRGGRDALDAGLRAAGVPVRTLDTYRRVRPDHPASLVDAALTPLPDIVSTTSDEVLDHLLEFAVARLPELYRRPLVVNGERAAAHARERGFAEVLVAVPPGDAGQLEALRGWLRGCGLAAPASGVPTS